MERRRSYIYPDKESLTKTFVCEFLRILGQSLDEGRQLHIALSGGSTPLAIFKLLAEQTKADNWSNIHLYWGDERCVPPDDPESNYGNALRVFLDPLGLNKDQIHRIRGEENALGEAGRYGDLLMNQLDAENGFPVFDWIWLGLGEDGHTASIFPHQIELWTAGSPCIVASHPDSAQLRISITGGVINVAKRVSFIASGKEKSRIVRDIFLKEGRHIEYPAFYVNPSSDNLEWYLDQEAAGLL